MENQNYEEVAQETEQKAVETIKIKFSRKLARAFTSKNGKDMVATFLTTAGFDVHDLGVDVAPSRFLEEAKKLDAKIIAAASLM